jgi:hypothetical protein
MESCTISFGNAFLFDSQLLSQAVQDDRQSRVEKVKVGKMPGFFQAFVVFPQGLHTSQQQNIIPILSARRLE